MSGPAEDDGWEDAAVTWCGWRCGVALPTRPRCAPNARTRRKRRRQIEAVLRALARPRVPRRSLSCQTMKRRWHMAARPGAQRSIWARGSPASAAGHGGGGWADDLSRDQGYATSAARHQVGPQMSPHAASRRAAMLARNSPPACSVPLLPAGSRFTQTTRTGIICRRLARVSPRWLRPTWMLRVSPGRTAA